MSQKNVKRIGAFCVLYSLVLPVLTFGQGFNTKNRSHKGEMYAYWGWNRGFFTDSDIHLHGETYDFTLKDVVATDRQTPFHLDPYLNPMKMTLPQTNFRLGWFFSDHYNISFGFDHMKYVVVQDQTVKINGEIRDTGTRFDGTYRDDDINISPDFMQLEHTNGLNYLNFELRRFDRLFEWEKVELNLTEGVSAGVLMPRTDAELLNFEDNNRYHVSGYGMGLMVGLNITFFRHIFIQSEAKGGYISMPSLRTTPYDTDKGDQAFFFGQYNFVFGFTVNLPSGKAG